MKISDFLKGQGVFSNEIKARFQNGQIKINGESVKEDIDLNVKKQIPDPKVDDIPFEAGDWIFHNLITSLSEDKKKKLFLITTLFDIETLFSGGCQINDKPVEDILPELNIMKGHIFLKTSKKQCFILKLNK
jgi:hypothetical protein